MTPDQAVASARIMSVPLPFAKAAFRPSGRLRMDDDEAPRLRLDGRFYMTPDGHTRLKNELAQLMRVERPRVVEIVSWAAANGDRSEIADLSI